MITYHIWYYQNISEPDQSTYEISMASVAQRECPPSQETTVLSLQESLTLPNLPPEIITEILTRLPVECLLRFISVSKSWRFLISSQRFVIAHREISAQKHESRRLLLLATISGQGRVCSIHSFSRENPSLVLPDLSRLSTSPCKSPRILGSCKGLICLSTVALKLLIWNPSTRKSREFPDLWVQRKTGCYVRYGFGFDEHTEDYKLIKVSSFYQSGGRYDNEVQSYSLKTDSWTMMSGFSSGYINGKCGVFLNGALHWEIRHADDFWEIRHADDFWEIIAIDLGIMEGKYKTISIPQIFKNEKFRLKLEVLDGKHLAACYISSAEKMVDVWVMKQYGLVESWTKVSSVSLLPCGDFRGYVSVVYMSENGAEFLLKLGTELVFYNSAHGGSFKKLEGYDYRSALELQSATYCESLALLDIGDSSRI
ncbi:unnamed protein product [Cuscuta europaea]|uniref:F-box domain-containing protein n=1 Tax=Cuscuta europaea TaxID=41803 RepID=A0A9P0ZKJ6_CUSEU|nr:unnamed protein product [Cuscuta europaea]